MVTVLAGTVDAAGSNGQLGKRISVRSSMLDQLHTVMPWSTNRTGRPRRVRSSPAGSQRARLHLVRSQPLPQSGRHGRAGVSDIGPHITTSSPLANTLIGPKSVIV